MAEKARYYVDTEKLETKPGYISHLRVLVYDQETGARVGEYKRNYNCMYNTFVPFKRDEQWYALYSPDYTATRVMKLPECVDIAGENPDSYGFCPTGYYVCKDGLVGLVTGCVWGDDSSWKIQLLDLRNITKGKLVRSDDFGYVSLAGSVMDIDKNVTAYVETDGVDLDLPITMNCRVEIPESADAPLSVQMSQDEASLYIVMQNKYPCKYRQGEVWVDEENKCDIHRELETAKKAAAGCAGAVVELKCRHRIVADFS